MCNSCFRFQKGDMQRLLEALNLQDQYICEQGTTASGMESLMIMLRRLSYPNRWTDLAPVFGRTVYEPSLIFTHVNIYSRFNFLKNSLLNNFQANLQVLV